MKQLDMNSDDIFQDYEMLTADEFEEKYYYDWDDAAAQYYSELEEKVNDNL